LTTDGHDHSYEFIPSEYDAAMLQFLSTGVRALMEALGGPYSWATREVMSQIPDSMPLLDDDGASHSRPIEAISDIVISKDDIVSGDFDGILVGMYAIAVELEGQISRAMVAHISENAVRAGNVLSGELSYDAITDWLEDLDFSFDENGNPNLGFVSTPEAAEEIRALGQPTPEQWARFNEIIAKRRGEWNARRNYRSLPSRRI
jgi:hypothetical protein